MYQWNNEDGGKKVINLLNDCKGVLSDTLLSKVYGWVLTTATIGQMSDKDTKIKEFQGLRESVVNALDSTLIVSDIFKKTVKQGLEDIFNHHFYKK